VKDTRGGSARLPTPSHGPLSNLAKVHHCDQRVMEIPMVPFLPGRSHPVPLADSPLAFSLGTLYARNIPIIEVTVVVGGQDAI